MSTIVHRLIHRLRHGATEHHTVMILGLDYAGKTTLLYLLRLGEIVTTIASIGINIETVNVPVNGTVKPLQFTGWDVGSGCGGTRYLRAMLPWYLPSSDAIIWLVDASDKERLEESVEMLGDVLQIVDREAENNGKVKSKFPILILSNKSDKPGALTIDQIRIAFSKVISGCLTSIHKISLTSTNTGLSDAFEWFNFALSVGNQPTPSPPTITSPSTTSPNTMPNPRSPTNLAQKLESWLTRSENQTDGLSDEVLLTRFHAFNLADWDHYTHIRLAYVILSKYGRQQGKDMLFKGLESYISASPDTNGKTFHLSMTYFWIQIVHFGIRNMPPGSQVITENVNDQSSTESKAALKPFSAFLLINPHVADSNLWSEYYSKSVLMSPKAKAEMVLPDKRHLPNLVIRDAIKDFGSATFDGGRS